MKTYQHEKKVEKETYVCEKETYACEWHLQQRMDG